MQIALPGLLARAERSISALIYCASPLASTTSMRHRLVHAAVSNTHQRALTRRAILATLPPRGPFYHANAAVAAQLSTAGWIARRAATAPLLHAKMWIIDDAIAIIGSHNLTDAALHSNHEISVSVDNAADIARLVAYFDVLWSRGSPF